MQIEIVGFYKNLDPKLPKHFGTLHVYLVDYGIDIRGVLVIKYKNKFILKMPSRTAIDEDTNQKVHYPIFAFSDHEKTQELFKTVYTLGQEFLKKEFTNQKNNDIETKKKKNKKVQDG